MFDTFLMPIGWFVGLVGAVGAGAMLMAHSINEHWWHRAFDLFLGMVFVPLFLVLVRFVRGHYSFDLKEP